MLRSGDGVVFVAWLMLLGAICWAFFRAGRISERRAHARAERAKSIAPPRPIEARR